MAPRRKQRGKTYGAEVQQVVETIVHSWDCPCAERLQPNLVWLGEQLVAHGKLELPEAVEHKLATISISTLKRMPPVQQVAERIAHREGQIKGS